MAAARLPAAVPSRVAAVLCAALAGLAPFAACAADEEGALKLADQTAAAPEAGSPWRVFAEGALREARERDGSELRDRRLSVDLRYEGALAPGWRAAFADRLDATGQDAAFADTVNTLKEAYATWQPRPDRIADAGRINARYGVALGYNPTDYFKAGAVRSVVSIDPASLRENRLGTVMARAQALWSEGSITGIYAPKLASEPSSAPFSADLGATNSRNRWLVSGSRAIGAFNPQWLVFAGEGAPQFGLNATALLGRATVVYAEWSGGRAESLKARSLALPGDAAFRSRLASGFTYTAPFRLSLTAEYDYNGAGLDRSGWAALARSPADYARYRTYAANVQEPATRENFFFYATWQDALFTHLDINAFQRRDRLDRSRLSWIEARYHWPRADAALQWQAASGTAQSDFGAAPDARALQLLLRYYF